MNNKTLITLFKRNKKRLAVIALMLFVISPVGPALALPIDGQAVEGTATFDQVDANTLNITVSDGSIIEYSSFNIAAGETVNFYMPNADAFSLNRVTGGGASEILGNLYANGNLILVNQNGINFGATANVNVAGLIASAQNIQNADFMAGNYIFSGDDVNQHSLVTNAGHLTAADGGFIVLAADAVSNTGTIEAPLGTVSLAGGKNITVALTGDGMISVAIDEATAHTILDADGNALSTQVSNSGTLSGATVKMNAQSAQAVFQSAINQEGIVRATDVSVGQDGVVVIGGSGPVHASGEVTAKSITITSDTDLFVQGLYDNVSGGTTSLSAKNNVNVTGDLTVRSGDLALTADSDLNGQGAYAQGAGTTVKTTTSGNITIQSSGESTLGTIESAGNVVLKSAGAAAHFTQRADTNITVGGSFEIQPTTTYSASNGILSISKDWVNNGSFEAGTSKVSFVGPDISTVYGDNNFFDFEVVTPGKTVNFEAGKTQEIFGVLTLQGNYGQMLNIRSTSEVSPAMISIRGDYTINFVNLQNMTNILNHGPPAVVSHSNFLNTNGFSADYSGPSAGAYSVLGTNTFFNFSVTSPGQLITFEADHLTTISGTLTVMGAADNFVSFNSTIQSVDHKFSIYINAVSDGQGNAYLQNLEVLYSRAYGPEGMLPIQVRGEYIPAHLNVDWDATYTWDGAPDGGGSSADNNWSTGNNWVGDVAPSGSGTDTLVFPTGAAQLSNNNDFANGTTFAGITLSGNGYTISGNDITLGGSGLTDSASTGSNTISFNIAMAAIRTYSVSNADETLTLSGVLSGTGGGVNKNGSGTLVLSGSNSYTASTRITAGTLSVNSVANGSSNSAIGASTSAVNNLIFAGGTLKYTGSGHSTDRLFTILNSSGATIDASGSGTLTFSNAGSLIMSGSNTARTLTLTGSGDASLAAIIPDNGSGATAVTKSGAGTWTLSAANTYTGVTTITAGTLSVQTMTDGGVASGIGQATNAATNLILDGGTLKFTGSSASTDRLFSVGDSGGTIDSSGSGSLSFTNTGSLGFNSETGTRTLTLKGSDTGSSLAAVLGDNSGASSLTKSGSGTWSLGSVQTYTGATTVSAGTLKINSANGISSSSAVTVNGTFDMMGTSQSIGSLAGSGTVTTSLGGSITLITGGDNTSTAFSGVIQDGSGTVGVTKQGSGAQTFSGANTFTGVMSISGGTLVANTVANGGSASSLGAGGTGAGNLFINNATLQYTGSGHSTDRLFTIGINGATLDASGSGTLTFSAGGNIVSAFSPAAFSITLTGSGNGALAGLLADSGGGGALSLTKLGAGTWTLSNGASTYTGVTTLSNGTLSVSTLANGGAASDIGASTNVAANLIIDTGTLLYTGAGSTSDRLFSLGASGGTITSSGSGALVLNNGGNIAFSGGGPSPLTLNGTNTDSNTLSAVIGDNVGALALTKSGAGTWVLNSGANTYTGVTTISGGVLSVGTLANGAAASDIGQSSAASTNLILNGGTLRYTGGAVNTNRLFSIGTSGGTIDSSGGNLTFSTNSALGYNGQTGTRTLTLTGSNSNSTLNPTLGDNSGASSLVKSGSGVWTLNNTSSYSGSTTITGGTLRILGDGMLGTAPGSPTASHLVLNGGTLRVTGTVTINSNRGIEIGSSGGTLYSGVGTSITYAGTVTGTGVLTTDGTGTVTFSSSVTVGGLTVNGSIFDAQNATLLDINGNLSIGSGNSMLVPGTNFKVSGNFSITVPGNISNVSKIEFDGSGTQNFDHSLIATFNELVHSGSGTLVLTGSGTLTLNSFTNSAGTFSLNGNNLTVNTSAFTNLGTIRLQGNEAVSLVTNDTTHGTWTYVGRNINEILTITDFGSSDYYNLTIDDQNGTKATFNMNSTMVINGTLTLSGGTITTNSYTLTAAAYTQTGGTFTGDSAAVTINGAAAISGSGTLMTLTSGTTQVITMSIDTGATVRLKSGSVLTITGSGSALTGSGTLDTTTNGNNTVQFTGSSVTIPVGSPFYNLSLLPAGFVINADGTYSFNQDEIGYASAVIDIAGGYAYFGTGTAPGIIVKIRLADLTRVGALTLNSGENYLTAAVIDGSYAYFGTNTAPGIVVKINLSTFTRDSAVTLNSGENYLYSAVIDTNNHYAYFGTNTAPAKVIKVDTNTFGRVGALTLNSGENYIYNHSGVIDVANGFAYFGTNTTPGIVVKVNLSNFTRVGIVTGASGEDQFQSAVINTNTGFAYFGTYTSTGKVIPIDLSNFTAGTTLTLNSGEGYLTSAVIDMNNALIYFGTDTASGKIVKVETSTANAPTRVGVLTLNANEDYLYSAVIDTTNGYAYFGTVSSPSYVVKIKLSDFSRVGALAGNVAENFIASAVVDTTAGYAYFGTFGTPGVIIKVRLSDNARIGALTLNSGENSLTSAVIDVSGGYAYFGTYITTAKVIKVRLSDFTRNAVLTLNVGDDYLKSAVIDTTAGFAYFGTDTSPGRVVKINLSSFTRTGALDFNSGENKLYSAAIDVSGGFAYFGTRTNPGIVVKVQLSNFTRAAALTLNSGEDYLTSAVIDPTGGFVYFGTDTAPGIVVKVQLSNFSRLTALTLNSGEDQLRTAVIDTTNGYAYFGTYTSPARIVKVKLSNFTRDAVVTAGAGKNKINAMVIDVTNNTIYAATDTAPGIRLMVRTGSGSIIFGTASSQTLTVNGFLEIGSLASAFASTYNPTINLAGDFSLTGSFTSTSGVFTIGGNFANNGGTFTANSGTVTMSAGVGGHIINGSNTFYNLTVDNSGETTGMILTFEYGATTTVTHALTLKGNATSRLQITSSNGVNQFYIDATGASTDLTRLQLSHSNAVSALAATGGSALITNNTNWTAS